jgi:hypothetical protein
MMLKQHPKAKVIGGYTSGANGDVISFNIAGLKTCFTGLGAYYPTEEKRRESGLFRTLSYDLQLKEYSREKTKLWKELWNI